MKKENYATKLEKYLAEHSINVTALAERLNMNYQKLYYIVRGITKLPADVAKQITELCNCQLDDII